MFRSTLEVEEVAPDRCEKVIAADRSVSGAAIRQTRFRKGEEDKELTRDRKDSENLVSKSPTLRLGQLDYQVSGASPMGSRPRQLPKSINTSSGITSTKSSSKNGQDSTLDLSRD